MKGAYNTYLVSGILLKDEKVLLSLRANTKDFADYWSLPVGHVEPRETELQAIERELGEELGIILASAIPFCYLVDPEQAISHQVYMITQWQREVKNMEPDYCAEIRWCDFDDLPNPITPVTRDILERVKYSDKS